MISAVIITKNEEDNIIRTLSALNDKRITEIIVVDSNSSDKTVALVQKINDNRIKLLVYNTPPYTAAHGRYLGGQKIAASNGYILFLDGDMEYNNSFTDIAIKYLSEDSTLAGILGQRDDYCYLNKQVILIKENIYNLSKLVVGGGIFLKKSSYCKTPGFIPELICDEEGILYSYIKKNGESLKRIANKMFIHHTEYSLSKKQILARLTDKKLGAFGITFFYALKDKYILMDFIVRNKNLFITGLLLFFLFTTIINCYFFIGFIMIFVYLCFALNFKIRLIINYSIYFIYSTAVFLRKFFQLILEKI
jgi:glycosyltransferase involved in cell wall biosynthesis